MFFSYISHINLLLVLQNFKLYTLFPSNNVKELFEAKCSQDRSLLCWLIGTGPVGKKPVIPTSNTLIPTFSACFRESSLTPPWKPVITHMPPSWYPLILLADSKIGTERANFGKYLRHTQHTYFLKLAVFLLSILSNIISLEKERG